MCRVNAEAFERVGWGASSREYPGADSAPVSDFAIVPRFVLPGVSAEGRS